MMLHPNLTRRQRSCKDAMPLICTIHFKLTVQKLSNHFFFTLSCLTSSIITVSSSTFSPPQLPSSSDLNTFLVLSYGGRTIPIAKPSMF
jgi:hypothetical protein